MLPVAISCAWVLGIFLGSIFDLPLVLILTGFLFVPFIIVLKKHRKSLILIALSLASLFGAAFYYPTTVTEQSHLVSFHNRGIIEIKGVIDTPPEIKDKITHIELTVREINVDKTWQKIEGKILLFTPRYPEHRYGDVLSVRGKLENPPEIENFNYQAYLAKEGIYSSMLFPQIEVVQKDTGIKPLGWIYRLRERLSQVLSSTLPEPQASLAQGIVLGIRSTIPNTLKTNLSLTGTAHLLAISGINLSIVAGILITLGLWLFGRRHYIYVWLALFAIWFYALITGMQAPVVRSAIMASIFLLDELLGRQKNIYVPLAFSAAIMVGITPQILWSVSFQLSFLAMLGLIIIAPMLQTLGRKSVYAVLGEEGYGAQATGVITDSFSITLGAIIAVWPLIAYYFGIISLVGPLSTLLISPVLSLIIFSGAITAVAGLISLPVAQVIGWTAWLFVSYMLWMVNSLASLPLAAINSAAIDNHFLWLYYLFLGLVIWIKFNFRKLISPLSRFLRTLKAATSATAGIIARAPLKWIAIPLLLLAFLTSFTAATMPDQYLHVNIMDVGEGDAILIQTGNQNILIDGGPSPQAISLGLSNKMPFWNRKLDLLVLTHPHLDHLSGLIEVLLRYRVEQVLAPNLISSSPSYHEWSDLIKKRNIRYTLAQAGQQVPLGNAAKLEILNPPDTLPGNKESDLENNGIVARLTRGKISFLFTADIGPESEARLIARRADLVCTVLKVSHHGSATSTTQDFLSVSRPQVAVISAGSNNLFGHPSEAILTRLEKNSIAEKNILRTDKSGTIEYITDGQRLWVKTERK